MKASEHFNLPLSAGDHEVIAERVYQNADYDHIAEFNTPEQAQIAARAINHADKLADALGEFAELIGLTPVDEGSQRLFEVYQKALGAIKAYRGAK